MEKQGKYKFRIVGRILEAEILDSWNTECAKQALSDFKALAKQLTDDEWACLVILDDWHISSPETETLFYELQSWCTQHNQKYEATVLNVDADEIQHYQKSHYVNGIEDHIVQGYFSCKQQAKDWLQQKGF